MPDYRYVNGLIDGSWGPLTLVPGEQAPVKVNADKVGVSHGAEATGGCDDIESLYGGKAAGNPDDWETKGEVRKTYHNGIRPDHMMFESTAKEKALAQEPRLCCPNCKQVAQKLGSAKTAYPVPPGVKIYESDNIPAWQYTLDPCGCRVSQEWATAFTAEINSRVLGYAPRAIADMPEQQRADKLLTLQNRYSQLLTERDHAKDKYARERVDFLLVVAADQIMRLVPGAHNRLPAVPGMSQEIKHWAEQHSLKAPADGALKPAFGYSDKYPMPKVDGASKSLASLQFTKSGESWSVDFSNGQRLTFISVHGLVQWLNLNDYDVRYLDKYLAEAVQTAKMMADYLPTATKMQYVIVPKKDGKTQKPSHPGLQTLPVGAPPANWKAPGKMVEIETTEAPVSVEKQASAAADELYQTIFGKSAALTPAQWFEQARANGGDAGMLMDAYKIADQLEQMTAYDCNDLLEYLSRHDQPLWVMVRGCMAQLKNKLSGVSINGTGVTPLDKTTVPPSLEILTDEHLLAITTTVRAALNKHRAFCADLLVRAVHPDMVKTAVDSELTMIAESLAQFASFRTPLTNLAQRFLVAYVQTTRQLSATVSGPVPLPDVAVLVENKLTELNAAAARQRKEAFHAQFARPRLRVRPLKKKTAD